MTQKHQYTQRQNTYSMIYDKKKPINLTINIKKRKKIINWDDGSYQNNRKLGRVGFFSFLFFLTWKPY